MYVTAERQPNAVALPGGSIFVSWPLLDLCEGQRDEVAFVLGHEMGHIVKRHTLDRLVKDAALSLLLRHSSGQRAASAWLSSVGEQALQRAYSSDNEFEADRFAVTLVRKAGGDALAGERFLERLVQLSSDRSISLSSSYFASHPSFAARLENLRHPEQAM